ncbi:Sjogren's syndrome/scleroderma autoantigen 1 family protein [Salarchaeum sp. III]|uniref:Sjogren's syndrome/scleroderma autoantigen 1 family protein n=1 Tax=Salarchaeum sp. III TaxID=3107927 RepID=UPI002EDAFF01
MSDEFDREEEKRQLREKYARDQQDREVTGRMSDLLLQGATMTNKHCDRCGSPIFRQNDEEFCPTCRAEDNQSEPADGTGDEPATADATASTPDSETAEDTATTTQSVRAPAPATKSDTAEQTASADEPTPASSSTDTATLDDARAALTDSVETLARRASETDDPRRAKDFLEAAHEAADTLDALDR